MTGRPLRFTKLSRLRSIRRQAVVLGGGAREARDRMAMITPDSGRDFKDVLDEIAVIGKRAAIASRRLK
jgi:hypothetical protein